MCLIGPDIQSATDRKELEKAIGKRIIGFNIWDNGEVDIILDDFTSIEIYGGVSLPESLYREYREKCFIPWEELQAELRGEKVIDESRFPPVCDVEPVVSVVYADDPETVRGNKADYEEWLKTHHRDGLKERGAVPVGKT